MSKAFAVGAVLALVLSVGVRAADQAEELKKLEGTWEFDSAVSNGDKAPAEELKKMKVIIGDGKIKVQQGDQVLDEMPFKISVDATPKNIDVTNTQGDKKGKEELGIYELDGDTLKICSSNPGEKRPTAFESKEGSKTDLLVLKRAKK